MIWAIGDVHGRIDSYEKICRHIRQQDKDAVTLQVGDMAIGMEGVRDPRCHVNDHFIAGNHDDRKAMTHVRGYLGDYGCHTICGRTVFWCGGAESVDRDMRTIGVDWWDYEQLSYPELIDASDRYLACRPEIVITHDCPAGLYGRLFRYTPKSRTVHGLQNMLDLHRPKVWVFGHHHVFHDVTVDGTRFLCLPELRHKKITL